MTVLLRLMVDRRTSSSAGLRSTSLGERTAKANHHRTNPCEAPTPSLPLSPAAQRLRSTMRLQRTRGERRGCNRCIPYAGSLYRSLAVRFRKPIMAASVAVSLVVVGVVYVLRSTPYRGFRWDRVARPLTRPDAMKG